MANGTKTMSKPAMTASAHTGEARQSVRLRRAAMEAGVVLSLTLAIVAVLCLFGLQKASALELTGMPGDETRIAVGAVLLSLFVGMCGLTSFMLRDTARRDGPSRRQG